MFGRNAWIILAILYKLVCVDFQRIKTYNYTYCTASVKISTTRTDFVHLTSVLGCSTFNKINKIVWYFHRIKTYNYTYYTVGKWHNLKLYIWQPCKAVRFLINFFRSFIVQKCLWWKLLQAYSDLLKVREPGILFPGTLSIFRNSKAHFEQNHAIFCRENFAWLPILTHCAMLQKWEYEWNCSKFIQIQN